MAPKSILKNKGQKTPVDTAAASNEQRYREIALRHAEDIQHRKDVESELFQSMLQLIDLPLSKDADPARPAPSDVDLLRRHLRLFQTRDFDELIEERKANGQCGYVLCPRRHRVESTTAQFRIITKSNNMKIVPREKLERWCSDACTGRAMFLKVQIPAEPAWLRPLNDDSLSINIKTEEASEATGETLPLKPRHGDSAEETADVNSGIDDLRLERGDSIASVRPGLIMSGDVSEKEVVRPAQEPEVGHVDTTSAVEGYTPKSKIRKFDDDADEDWGI